MSALRFDGWVPFRLYWQGGEPGIEWLYMGNKPFTDPFFDSTIQIEAQTPFNSLFRFRTPFIALADWHAASPGLQPSGFIFHLSRSGSTLVSRMLAALPDHMALSEPGVLDRWLRECGRVPGASLEQRALWVRWLVSALGQRRTGLERRLYIKFDPRSIVELPILRLAFPDVPWIFVYRNPVEVMVSNQRAPSALLTRGFLGPEFLDFDASLIAGMDDEEYTARVLGIVAATAARLIESEDGLPVEYRELPDAMWGGLQKHLGLDFTTGELAQMKRVVDFDAKRPDQRFASDSESKKREASERVRELAERWIGPHYAKLEAVRQSRTTGFPALRRLVLANPDLLVRLRGLDREAFLASASQVAAQAGIALQQGELERAIWDARQERAGRLL
jgi:hypothetical protein